MMKKIFKELKWFFYDSVVCKHTYKFHSMRDLGLSKEYRCSKCGKISSSFPKT